MATAQIKTEDFSLSSGWRCKKTFVYHGTQSYGHYEYRFTSGPSYSQVSKSFQWSIPSGAAIKKAQIWATINVGWTGASVLTANGNLFDQTYESEKGANISLTGTSGTLEVTFAFKANGNRVDENDHSSTTAFKNVYLWIEYEGEAEPSAPAPPKLQGMPVPPQSVCVYDQENGAIYLFDGVTKIQHALSMKIEEEPEKHKDEYVNNARNEPDKLTLDVVMSDVYDGSGAIVNARAFTAAERTAFDKTKSSLIARNSSEPYTRSENAFYVLHDLKEARRKLSVITPHFVHTDMILASITVNQDEEHTDGWEGQIVFQHTYKAPAPKNNNSTPKKTTPTPPSPATGIVSGLTNFGNKLKNFLGFK